MHVPTVIRTAYRPGERHQRHAHDYANVSVVLAGSLEERVGRWTVIARPLSVVVKPVGTEHANVFGPQGAVLLQMPVPASWLLPMEDGARAVDRWRWTVSAPAARWLLRLAAGAPSDDSDGIAECLGAVELDTVERGKAAPEWLQRVRERIRDEGGRVTSVANLARGAGVHPVYLTRRFRRAYGCSVVAFQQAERIRATANAVGLGGESMSRIAHGAGFADQPHFTRTFRRIAGVTPAMYRRLARPAITHLRATDSPPLTR